MKWEKCSSKHLLFHSRSTTSHSLNLQVFLEILNNLWHPRTRLINKIVAKNWLNGLLITYKAACLNCPNALLMMSKFDKLSLIRAKILVYKAIKTQREYQVKCITFQFSLIASSLKNWKNEFSVWKSYDGVWLDAFLVPDYDTKFV